MNEMEKWFEDRAEYLRYKYNLNKDSVVLDIGMYKGEFVDRIFKTYGCNIIGFEPIFEYYNICTSRFQIGKIKLFNFGLGAFTREEEITIDGDCSSILANKENIKKEKIKIISVLSFLKLNNIEKIDLMKINIEGMEYELLETLLYNSCINNINNIQVQFHDFVPDAEEKRKNIVDELILTHEPTFCYPFVWENYVRRGI